MAARIDYNPQNVRELSDAQLRKAYSEVRSIARKRVERMAKSEFVDTDIANRSFPTVRQVKTEDLRNALLDVSQFVRDPRSLLNYHRNIVSKTLNTLESHGYSIPRENLKILVILWNLPAIGGKAEKCRHQIMLHQSMKLPVKKVSALKR